jgi:hypothetical protein
MKMVSAGSDAMDADSASPNRNERAEGSPVLLAAPQQKLIRRRQDLRPHLWPAGNQGKFQSAAAHAVTAALEYQVLCEQRKSVKLSPMFVYYNIRKLKNAVEADPGATIPEAIEAIRRFGACRQELWPFDPASFAKEPPKEAYDDGISYGERISFAPGANSKAAIELLSEGWPVAFTTEIPAACYMEAEITGVMPQPMPVPPWFKQSVPHSMLLVGFDQDERVFIARNSWGEDWGERGHCRIPFNVLDSFTPEGSFWRLIREQKPADSMSRDAALKGLESQRAQPAGRVTMASQMRDQIRSSLKADILAASRKVDELLAGKDGAKDRRHDLKESSAMPCPSCSGVGVCPQCNGKQADCGFCGGAGVCNDCGGAGIMNF